MKKIIDQIKRLLDDFWGWLTHRPKEESKPVSNIREVFIPLDHPYNPPAIKRIRASAIERSRRRMRKDVWAKQRGYR